MKRYLISMGIRTVCVILAVVVPGPLRWVFIAGAVLLPYVAVVMANAVGERREQPVVARPRRDALPATATRLGEPQVYIPETGAHVGSSERVIRESGERTG